MIRKTISSIFLCLFFLPITAQDKTAEKKENTDLATDKGILLNLNTNYRKFGNSQLTTAGFKIAVRPTINWAIGAHFIYDRLTGVDDKLVSQLRLGPFARYYIVEENYCLFIGAQTSYASFKVDEYASLGQIYYGPQLGLNIPLKEFIFLEFMAEHLWVGKLENESTSNLQNKSHLNYEIGLTLLF